MDKEKRTFKLDKKMSFLYLCLMAGDADGYHYKVIEYDPTNEKEVRFDSCKGLEKQMVL